MTEPIDKPDFWRARLRRAQSEGRLYYSVYLTHADDWAKIEKVHAAIIRQLIGPDQTVLDAGCGFGRLAGLFSSSMYVGVDLSPDLLSVAREKYPEHTFMEANLEALPYKDKSFEWAVFSSIKQMVIGNMGEDAWARIEREAQRVARHVLILEYHEPEKYEVL